MKNPDQSPVAVELNMRKLTAAIERERVRRQLTHRDLAAEFGVAYSTYSYWRRNCTTMTGSAAVRISFWLGRDLRDFARQKPAADLPQATPDAA